jgi:hypothetical protein
MNQKRTSEILWLAALLAVLCYFYLSPGLDLALMGQKDKVMSDGTDPTTLPFQYGLVKYHLAHSPGQLFYGAIPNPVAEAPEGNALWMPWIEKIIAVFLVPFAPLEQLQTWVVFFLLLLNGLAAYWFGRAHGWPKPVCVALAICWAFNPFTRARARVHNSLTGIFFLPLIFVGLHYVKHRADRRSLAYAAAAFLLAATAAQYYILMIAFLTPLFLLYIYWPRDSQNPRAAAVRALIAVIPAALFTAWCFLKPLPSDFVKPGLRAMPATGDYKDASGVHPFLRAFASHPIDYFAGDTGIGASDWNPLRKEVSRALIEDVKKGNGNFHERTNGIRWGVLGLFFFGLFLLLRKSASPPPAWLSANVKYFALLALAGFALSLPPDFLGPVIMPSAWLHALVAQFRVPSRAGVFAHFGALAAAAFVLVHLVYRAAGTPQAERKRESKKEKKNKSDAPAISAADAANAPDGAAVVWHAIKWQPKDSLWARRFALPFVIPLLAVVDFPPFMNDMPVWPVMPAYEKLTGRGSEPCGYGMYFPYVSPQHELLEMYTFVQRMRGTQCRILNGAQVEARNAKLLRNFAYVPKIFEMIKAGDRTIAQRLVQLARCVPMEWIAFSRDLPPHYGPEVCATLGWEWTAPDVCRAKERGVPLASLPENCLK